MYKQSFRLAFEGEMVVTNTTFVLEKFLINVFPPKDFLNSLLKFSTAGIVQIEKGTLDFQIDMRIFILDYFNLKINIFNKVSISDLKKLFLDLYLCMGCRQHFL